MPDAEEPPVPEWLKRPFMRYFAHHVEMERVLHLCMHGISLIPEESGRLWRIAEALKLDTTDLHEDPSSERLTREAKKEIEAGFPLLHEQATVALWGGMEAYLKDVCAEWLLNRKEALQGEVVGRLRVRVGQYESLDPEERARFLVDLIDQEVSAPLKSGVGRFEALLDALGLGGPVDDGLRKRMFELSQVRNLVVHRQGIVDRRFAEACPWVSQTLGERLKINHQSWSRYHDAVNDYIGVVSDRWFLALGLPYRFSKKPAGPDGGASDDGRPTSG